MTNSALRAFTIKMIKNKFNNNKFNLKQYKSKQSQNQMKVNAKQRQRIAEAKADADANVREDCIEMMAKNRSSLPDIDT